MNAYRYYFKDDPKSPKNPWIVDIEEIENGILDDVKDYILCRKVFTGKYTTDNDMIFEGDVIRVQSFDVAEETNVHGQVGTVVYEPEAMSFLLEDKEGKKWDINPYGVFERIGNSVEKEVENE